MKKNLSFLTLLFLLCVDPFILHAEIKTITEADVATPIVVNQGDKIIFSLSISKQSTWTPTILLKKVLLPSGTNIPAGTAIPTDPLLQESIETFNSLNQGSWIEIHYSAVALGQEVILFTAAGIDPVYQYERTCCFIVNIEAKSVFQ